MCGRPLPMLATLRPPLVPTGDKLPPAPHPSMPWLSYEGTGVSEHRERLIHAGCDVNRRHSSRAKSGLPLTFC